MAVTAAPRTGISRWSAESDPFTRTQADADHALLDSLVAIDVQDLLSNRPAPGIRGRFFTESSASAGLPGTTWREDGTTWRSVGSRIAAVSTTDVGQVVRGAASQSADLGQYQNSAGTVLTSIDNAGVLKKTSVFTIGQNADPTTLLQPQAANQRALIARGFASQSVDIFDVQTSASAALFSVSATAVTVGSGVSFTAPSALLGTGATGSAVLNVTTGALGTVGISVKAVASQTANQQEWINSAGNVMAYVGPDGNSGQRQSGQTAGAKYLANGTDTELWFYSTADSNPYAKLGPGGSTLQASATGVTPLVVAGFAAQSADLQRWSNSAFSVLSRVDSAGSLITTGNVRASGWGSFGNGGAQLFGASLGVKGAASVVALITQAGTSVIDSQQWADQNGINVASMSASGGLTASNLQVNSTSLSFPNLLGAPGGPVWKYLYWDSNTTVGRTLFGATVSSSVTAKQEIAPVEDAHIEALLGLQPSRFRYRSEVKEEGLSGRRAPHYFGLLAEDVIEAGLRDLVMLDSDGRAVTIYYDRIGAMLLPVIRDLRSRVQVLESRFAA